MKRIKLLPSFICIFFIYNASIAFNANKNTTNVTLASSVCPAAVISNFFPESGPENTLVTISGSNFSTATNVTFDGVSTTFNIISDNEIEAYVPAGISASATISIISYGGCTGNATTDFTFLDSQCSTADVYISEIYDAISGSYAVIELYNPTNAPIVLDGVYIIERYGDIGNAAPSHTYNVLGTIPPLDTFIIILGSGSDCPSLVADFNVGTGINDNDEFKLLKNGVLIDIVHAPDERGYTIIRNPDAAVSQTSFDSSDWTIDSQEDCSDLDSHTADPIPDNTPTITNPTSQTICENGTATFTVSISGTETYTYQWMVLNAAGNWVNVTNNTNYSGATTNTLTIANAPLTFDANQYYCQITSTSCDLVSNAAQLNVGNAEVDTLSNETVCTSYTLPTLTNGNYFTATNGGGSPLNAGDIITATQTIYIYNEVGTAPDTCSNESSFTITVSGTPPVDTLSNETVCTSYTLPTLTNGNYFTATNGGGTSLNAGDTITATQTIYIYNEVGTAPDTCSNESSFTITVSGTPPVDTLSNETVCTSYTLPTLTNGNYFTATNGGGTPLNAGDIITTTQTIYIYNEVGTAPDTCSNESSFTITVNGTPPVDTLSNETVCTSYTLPTLTNGNYFTATNGGGTPLNAGDIITATQTIYIYNEVGTAPDTCSNESSFTITVSGTPPVDTLSNETVCTSYTLPTLTNGNYFTATNGGGTPLNAGDTITATQTIYIYNEVGTAPNTCSNESSFTITVSGTPPVDTLSNETVCTSYTLPTLTNGNYFTATNGGGTPLNAGDIITATQTIYIYNEVGTAPDTCSNESSFTITVSGTPPVDTLSNETVCTSYTLPTLTNGNYFTATNGGGSPLNAGDTITTSQTIYIYNEVGTAPDTCSNESSFTITISGNPPVDTLSNETVCTNYTLPTLTNGNYFTATNGGGTPLNAGDIITTTQTIYIYNEVGTAPDTCSNESSFTITVSGTPPVDTLSNETVCSSYTLPTLTNGNYFTATNGGGSPLNAGDIITTTQTIFIYNEVGTAPDTCSNESSFTITISGNPPVDTLSNEAVCTSYTLPTLTNGNYFTATNGGGSPLNAGDTITTSQTIYIYNETGTAPDTCTNESSFTITIYPATDFTLTDANITIVDNTITVNMTDTSINYLYAVDTSALQANPTFTNVANGNHLLYVQDENGCIIKALPFTIDGFVEINIPLFFTPNGDGYNDTWLITDNQNTIKEILIFDRYGKLLKQVSPALKSWDGIYNGYFMESNDYWYLITLHTGKTIKGHFTLKR
ncbi:T9SS type B sorting domain-containing protein [Lacinutrix gracilariae]|uniref:T9SS type B sorting domain-containing protein n=1 Tax=Lacinutrix gracilariae TaxID=1747198 RepID=A0ABW5JXE8_9FLAO